MIKCKNCGHGIEYDRWGVWYKPKGTYIHNSEGKECSHAGFECHCGCQNPEPEEEGGKQ